MIGTISHPHIMHVNAITRARAKAQGIVVSKEPPKPKETCEPEVDKVIPLDYPSAEVELESLKALQEWIDEERIRFESRKIERRSIRVSQERNSVEPPQSIR